MEHYWILLHTKAQSLPFDHFYIVILWSYLQLSDGCFNIHFWKQLPLMPASLFRIMLIWLPEHQLLLLVLAHSPQDFQHLLLKTLWFHLDWDYRLWNISPPSSQVAGILNKAPLLSHHHLSLDYWFSCGKQVNLCLEPVLCPVASTLQDSL